MWKLFKGIPRVFRSPRGSIVPQPPQSCSEEDHSLDGAAVQVYGKFTPRCCRREGSSGLHPDEETWSDWKWNSFDRNTWQDVRHPLEAIGWGTAIVLGVQLTRIWQSFHSEDDRHYIHHGRKVQLCPIWQRLVYAMPGRQGALTIKSVLDGSQQTPNANNAKIGISQKEQGATFEEGITEAWHDYESLSDLYVSMRNNILGLQHSRAGRYTDAIPYWKKASDMGYAKAQFNLALCHALGKGTPKNMSKAIEYYQMAADAGHPQAMYNLAVLHLRGTAGLTKNSQMALQLLEKSAELGLKQSQTQLGVLFAERDCHKSAMLFDKAANQGDSLAQYYLAVCYENGIGVDKNECQAAALYSKAANSGNVAAKFSLGIFFENGLGGLPVDMEGALSLYKDAASLGHPGAEERLQVHTETEEEPPDGREKLKTPSPENKNKESNWNSRTSLKSDNTNWNSLLSDKTENFSWTSPLSDKTDNSSWTSPKSDKMDHANSWTSPLVKEGDDGDKASSSLTNYVRQHLLQFGFVRDRSPEYRPAIGSDSRVLFYIGDEPDDPDSLLRTSHCGINDLSRSELHRQSSFQDFSTVACS